MADFAANIQINRRIRNDFWQFITFKQKESAEFSAALSRRAGIF